MRATAAERTDFELPANQADDGGIRTAPLRCVIMDDNRFDRRQIRRIAEKSRFDIEIVETATIAETRAVLRAREADFVVFDNLIPDGNGISFAKEIAADARTNGVPVIVTTGEGSERIAVEAIRAGVADYLVKDDLSTEVFDQAVENALKRSSARVADQTATISNLQVENATLRRVALRNMRLLKAEALPLMAFAWRILRGEPLRQEDHAKHTKGLTRITRTITGLIDDTVITAATHRANDTEDLLDLKDIVQSLIEDDLGEIADSRAHIIVHDLPKIRARFSHISMMFEELLVSAVRSGRLGKVPEIVISSSVDPDGNPVIVFSENGLQLSARKQSLAARVSDLGGTVSDLRRDENSWSLCQRLAEKNGGQFKISESNEAGSRILIRFPKERLGVEKERA